MTLLSKKLVDWLRYASITQGGGASSGGFFTGPRSRQVQNFHIWYSPGKQALSFQLFQQCHICFCFFSALFDVMLYYFIVYLSFCLFVGWFQPVPIAELDGTVSGDFFTVLCVGQGFTEDQWMNVYSFSMLRHWLLTYHSVSNGNTAVDSGMTINTDAKICPHVLEALYFVIATKLSYLHFRSLVCFVFLM